MNNIFLKDGLYFIVPLKCGFTAFHTADKRGLAVRLEEIDRKTQCCAVVRSPVDRLQSFFADKLRVNVTRRLVQDAQLFVMREFGYTDCLDLMKVSFHNFVSMLEAIPEKQWDSHLWPMTFWFHGKQFCSMVNISTPEDSDWLFKFLEIDRTKREEYNKTDWAVEITTPIKCSIERLYAADFAFLKSWECRSSLPKL